MNDNTLIVKILFDGDEPEKACIKTNATKDGVKELLETWLITQMGNIKYMKQAKGPSFEIEIKLDLTEDTFHTTSNTGTDGFTCGIIMDVFDRLDAIPISDLD